MDHNVQHISKERKIPKTKKANVQYDEHTNFEPTSQANTQHAAQPVVHHQHLNNLSANLSWLAPKARPADHAQAVENLQGDGSCDKPQHRLEARHDLREHRAAFAPPIPINKTDHGDRWPMDTNEKPPFPPPWPSKTERIAMMRESSASHPEQALGHLAQAWVNDLERWYHKLQGHFQFDPSDLALNLRNNLHKWKRRLSYLRKSQPQLYDEIVGHISVGHKIPLDKEPRKFFRHRNPPSLAADKVRAWRAIKKDIGHGAIEPVDLEQGAPHCVCPVRTADKSDGSARFVHNSRRVNKCVPAEKSKCKLESLLRTRNMLIPGGFLVGSDFSSGYHCISMHKDHRKYVAFALHVSELPPDAVEWLKEHYPESFLPNKQCFVFRYAALPFGLSSSCKTFNDLISALMGFWRRCPLDGNFTRVSSYIDDVSSVAKAFDTVSATPLNPTHITEHALQ